MLKHQQKKLPRQGAVKGNKLDLKTREGLRIYLGRLQQMSDRQGSVCAICQEWKMLFFDHEAGRGHGGGHRDDRIEVDGGWQNAALCEHCNSRKGSKRYKWQNGFYKPVEKFKEVA